MKGQTTADDVEEAKAEYESKVESIDVEYWVEHPVLRLIFEETTDPYHAFISDVGVRDGGNGKKDSLFANAYEFAHGLRGKMMNRLADEVIPGNSLILPKELLETYEDPLSNPLTHEHAYEVMRRAEEEGLILVTESRRHVYHPETEVIED